MTRPEPAGNIYLKDELCELVASIAAPYQPRSAIDPCCSDAGLIGYCTFANNRTAMFRSDSAMRDAAIRFADVNRVEFDLAHAIPSDLATVDLVICCLPFGVKERRDGRIVRIDELIAQRCLPLIAPDGTGIFIWPQNFLTAPAFCSLRRLVQQVGVLEAVVDLPRGTMSETPFLSGALVVVRRNLPNRSSVFMGQWNGHDTGSLAKCLATGEGDFFVERDHLTDRWDRNFHDPQHRHIEDQLELHPSYVLSEIAECFVGQPFSAEQRKPSGEFLLIGTRHLRGGAIEASDRDWYVDLDSSPRGERAIVRSGDILVDLIHSNVRIYCETDPPAIANQHIAVIRSLNNEYIKTFFDSKPGQAFFRAQAERHSRGGTMSRLSLQDLLNFRIPVLPIEDPNAISDTAIATANALELDELRSELLRVKQHLEVAEARLAEARKPSQSDGIALVMERLSVIESHQLQANLKLDNIAVSLSQMNVGIIEIKQSSRNDEEKLIRINAQLETWTKDFGKSEKSISEYSKVVRNWNIYWDLMEPLSQTFLTTAEHLFDEYERLYSPDFSPVVLQFSRAVECELLHKMFLAYLDNLDHCGVDIPSLVEGDIGHEKTGQFAGKVKRTSRDFTLGEIGHILPFIKEGGSNLQRSLLLQNFRAFLLERFDKRVVEEPFCIRVQALARDFRNKAAHPDLLDVQKANECREHVKMCLLEFLSAYTGN